LSKVSQKVAVPPNCMLQFPVIGVGVGVGVDVGVGVGVGVDIGVGVGVGVEVGVGVPTDAEQLAVVPPLEPLQLHVHGPEPATDDAVPAEQRLVEGADDACAPFDDPHTPLIATGAALTATVALSIGDVPPVPLQISV